jgi:RNA polymerase sigma factor (sigma-70 family)
MNEIIRRFEPLIQKIAWSRTTRRHDQDVLANAARIGLVHAVRRHDAGRLGFASYAKRYMSGAAAREGRRALTVLEVPFQFVGDDADVFAPAMASAEDVADLGNPWSSDDMASAMSTLPTDQAEILRLRYVDELPLSDIAIMEGTSPSAVSQRLATARRALQRRLT